MIQTVEQLIHLKESEDKIEFKEAKGGNFSYNGGTKIEPAKRRRCILGYVTAFANEGGGYLIFGISDKHPHQIIGTTQSEGAIGQLESRIYNDTKIRVVCNELFDKDNKRILIIKIPARPAGKVYKFEDVALMRIGEELKPMSDEMYLKIIQEQEPDFSEKIASGVTITDLDHEAIKVMKEKYAKKHNNQTFLALSDEQILSDLSLTISGKVTNAAVILLAKEEVLRKQLPQSAIMLEYRKSQSQIPFDNRIPFSLPYFLGIDKLWDTINLRNDFTPVQEGPYIFDIPYFNQEVIREAINNAIAHRDYRRTSETVIKQYPTRLDIINPGGFPIGVTIQNLLTVASTPRNRLLADVLQKTGIVERSGQGVDKIFNKTLSEGKKEPDYSESDDFQVNLKLFAELEDKAFALFIEAIQTDLAPENKLSVAEIIALNNIRKEKFKVTDKPAIQSLLKRKLIEKHGKTRAVHYILSKEYYQFSEKSGQYSNKVKWNEKQSYYIILQHLQSFKIAKMGDFVDLFEGQLSRRQVRTLVEKLVERKELKKEGTGYNTEYSIGDNFLNTMNILSKAINIGLKQMEKSGEIGSPIKEDKGNDQGNDQGAGQK